MVASFAGQVEAVRFLLDVAHFPLEERDKSLRTPIHLATKSGSIAVVRLLLERGADPDRMDEAQRTALTYAAAAHNVSLLSCLLDGGADPDVTDQSLRTCLHYLAEGGHSHCGGGRGGMCGRAGEEAAAEAGVRLLLLYGAQADIGDMSGHTPLHLAAVSSNVGVVKLLLGLGGADTSLRDRMGMRAVELAKGREVEAMLKATPYQAYCLKRLRCVVGMMVKGGEDGGEEGGEEGKGQEGGNGGKKGEEEEGQDGQNGGTKEEEGEGDRDATTAKKEEEGEGGGDAAASSSRPLKGTESQVLTAAEEVRHSVMRRRQAVEPPRRMPTVEFHHSDGTGEKEEKSNSRDKECEKVEGGEKVSYSAIPPADLPARVLEEAVRTINGDLFFELLDLLWPWSVTSS